MWSAWRGTGWSAGTGLAVIGFLLLAVAATAAGEAPEAKPSDRAISPDVKDGPPPVQTEEEKRAAELLKKMIEREQLRRDVNRTAAENSYRKGRLYYDNGAYRRAAKELQRALAYDSSYARAKALLKKCEMLLGEEKPTPVAELVRSVEEREIVRQFERARMLRQYEDARELLRQKKYATAINLFEKVLEAARWLEPYMDVSQLKQNVALQIREATEKKALWEKERAMTKMRLAQDRILERQRKEREEQKRLARNLLARGRKLFAEERFEESMRTAEALIERDPRNQQARQLLRDAFRAFFDKRQQEVLQEHVTNHYVAILVNRQDSIPGADLDQDPVYLKYPPKEKWEQILQRTPPIIGEEAPEDEKWQEDIRKKLEERVSFTFADTDVEDVVQFLHSLTGVTIILDKKALDAGGQRSITLRVNDMKLSSALKWILRLVGLEYTLRDGAIFISDKSGVKDRPMLRMYDVTDLTYELHQFPGNLSFLRGRAGTGTEDTGGGGDDWGETVNIEQEEGGGTGFTGKGLVDFIRENIEPESWTESEEDLED